MYVELTPFKDVCLFSVHGGWLPFGNTKYGKLKTVYWFRPVPYPACNTHQVSRNYLPHVLNQWKKCFGACTKLLSIWLVKLNPVAYHKQLHAQPFIKSYWKCLLPPWIKFLICFVNVQLKSIYNSPRPCGFKHYSKTRTVATPVWLQISRIQ